jgi:hypothetical protein
MCCWSGPSFLFSVTNVSGQKKKEVTQQQQYTHQVIIRVGRTLWPLSLSLCDAASQKNHQTSLRQGRHKKKKETHFHLPATSAQKKVFIGHWGLTGSVYAYFFYRPVSIFMRQPLCFAFFFSQIKMK